MASKGFDVWLPSVTEKRRWTDRWKEATLPLFPGYLFTSTKDAGYAPVLKTPGVLTLVKEGRPPAVLTASYVDRLKAVVSDPTVAVEPAPQVHEFAAWDEVLVTEGPLAGFRGVVTEVRGTRRLIVNLAGIGRGLLLVLGAALVQPVQSVARGKRQTVKSHRGSEQPMQYDRAFTCVVTLPGATR